jgi:hypothetical protein
MITMSEFIKLHKLKVDLRDPASTKLIAKKFRDNGYVRRKRRYKGKVQWVWTNAKDESERLQNLNAKLEVIEI